MAPGGLGDLVGGWDGQRKGRKGAKQQENAKQAEPGDSRRSGERRLRAAVRDDRRIVSASGEVLRNGRDVFFAEMGGSFADSTGKLTFYSDLWRKVGWSRNWNEGKTREENGRRWPSGRATMEGLVSSVSSGSLELFLSLNHGESHE